MADIENISVPSSQLLYNCILAVVSYKWSSNNKRLEKRIGDREIERRVK
jgi:hypothetical protein